MIKCKCLLFVHRLVMINSIICICGGKTLYFICNTNVLDLLKSTATRDRYQGKEDNLLDSPFLIDMSPNKYWLNFLNFG